MSAATSPTTARAIVEDVLGRAMSNDLWTGNYGRALPISVQDFDLAAVLPAVFYMFRFGVRRGKGKFYETFGAAEGTPRERKRAATTERVAEALARVEGFNGFDDDIARAILADLLLCYCLENRGRTLGRNEQVQRVAPAHYLASWIDLPAGVSNLRFVPEMIVALLANQDGSQVEPNQDGDKTWFAVGRGFEDNVLLQAFHQGVVREGLLGDRNADRFQEETSVGLDQLLMIRLAQQLGQPPDRLRGQGSGGSQISNQRPIAEQAACDFSEDLRRFVQAYAKVIPRQAFVELLESCMSVGLTTIITSSIEILFEWARTGAVRKRSEQSPAALFVDCSNGIDPRLRGLAEQSLSDYFRRVEYIPTILMALRLLDHGARYNPKLKKLAAPTPPYATAWLDLLGDILFQRQTESALILSALDQKAQELAERLAEDYPDAAAILQQDGAQPSPVWRLAEALTLLQGRTNTHHNLTKMLDSACLMKRPQGLATSRMVQRQAQLGGSARKRDLRRSLVFTDSVLDYLVHRHVLPTGNKGGVRSLAFQDFLELLRKRHGLFVDVSPPGMSISNEHLRANRLTFERRLRDLGLLVGVNDAEAMKRLRPRFERQEAQHGLE